MNLIAGIDIGNATTETALAKMCNNGKIEFLSSATVKTTGIKGTSENIAGIYSSLKKAITKANENIENLDKIYINEAAPVIGDVAMETITETIITESTMIGHNPTTPGGIGIGIGQTINLLDIQNATTEKEYIVIVDKSVDFEDAAKLINENAKKIKINGAIVCKDDGVLINNRIECKIPIIDEVLLIEKIPIGMPCAIEVADVGNVVETLSNPYGIATLFNLDSEDTKFIVPIAKALIGNRSAVVIKTPKGDVKEHFIPAGSLYIFSDKRTFSVDVKDGSTKIMEFVSLADNILDIKGEAGTNVGGMIEKVRQVMSKLTNDKPVNIKIQDLLAVDTSVPQKIKGGLANEFCLENAVGIAVMVKSNRLQMEKIAKELESKLNVLVTVGGVEANMAINGALTTPGTSKPIAILDMGAGSTDASIMSKNGETTSIHLAGAGDMVTLLIQSELGLPSFNLAEDIKKYPLAKVESMFHIRHEDGTVQFFEEPLSPNIFSRIVIIKDDALIPLEVEVNIEKIKAIRRESKEKVFVKNAIRALKKVSNTDNISDIDFVVLVGGSALDFEIPQLVMDELFKYKIVAGRGNIRGSEGPRNAVATGLLIANCVGAL